jgi:hypothetical protein
MTGWLQILTPLQERLLSEAWKIALAALVVALWAWFMFSDG